jgi:hypothetical protein
MLSVVFASSAMRNSAACRRSPRCAFEHLLLQHAVGVPQRVGAFGDAPLEFLVRHAPFQCGLDVLRDIGQQRAILVVEARVLGITLHNDTADDVGAAQQRHADASRRSPAEVGDRRADLRGQLRQRAHQRAAALDQMPGQAVRTASIGKS